MSFDVKAYVDSLFDKKKIKQIRTGKKTKKGKKKALKKQFKHINKGVKKIKGKKAMSKRAVKMVDRLNDDSVNHIWKNTRNLSDSYVVMKRLDKIEKLISERVHSSSQQSKPRKKIHHGNIHTIHDYN